LVELHQGASVQRKTRRQCITAAIALLIGGVFMPVSAKLFGEFHPQAGIALPPVLLLAAICLIVPRWGVALAGLPALYAVEFLFRWVSGKPVGPSLIDELARGKWLQLKVAIAAVLLGMVIVWARKRFGGFPRGFRTNLRVLTRRPQVFARKYWRPLCVLLLAAGLDAATTIAFMPVYGTEEEAHPAMRIMAETFGVWAGVIVGTLVRLGFVLAVAAVWRKSCPWVLWICAILYLLAAASNHFGWLGWLWTQIL
jgi:hypothetical protein